jgi:hypothetical protein
MTHREDQPLENLFDLYVAYWLMMVYAPFTINIESIQGNLCQPQSQS